MAIKSLSIRIDEQVLHKLHVVADYEGRSANSQILILILGLLSIVVNIIFSFILIEPLAHGGLALANSLAASRSRPGPAPRPSRSGRG